MWQAEATTAGRFFVEHGRYPDGHRTPIPPTRSTTSGPASETTSDQAAGVSSTVGGGRERKVTGLRPVEQLIADVVAGGGSLDVSDRAVYTDALIGSATRSTKIPDGKLLTVTPGRSWGERALTLVDKPAWMTAPLDPVPVADRLTRPHPAVTRLRGDRDRLRFTGPTRQRALRILDAAAKEATRRGHTVDGPPATTGAGQTYGPYPRSVDTGCDYAAVGSVAAQRAS